MKPLLPADRKKDFILPTIWYFAGKGGIIHKDDSFFIPITTLGPSGFL